MPPRTDLVTFNGMPLTLVGDPIQQGDRLPDVPLVDPEMKPRTLGEFGGRVLLISAVGSLDTSVCDAQTRAVTEKTTELGDEIVRITVSIDTPMAQARWCRGANDEGMIMLSDFKEHAFGHQTGLRVEESGMLARALIVVDRQGVVRYVQISPDVDVEPEYEPAVEAARALL
jgi:thioredoxin-dependent peroxiredoxin